MINGLKQIMHKERQRELGLLSIEIRKLRGKFNFCLQPSGRGSFREEKETLFPKVHGKRTRCNNHKLQQNQLQLNIREKIFLSESDKTWE